MVGSLPASPSRGPREARGAEIQPEQWWQPGVGGSGSVARMPALKLCLCQLAPLSIAIPPPGCNLIVPSWDPWGSLDNEAEISVPRESVSRSLMSDSL